MSVLYVAIPVALVLAAIAVVAFVFQVRSGQFDDLDTPPQRMLFDDVESQTREPTVGKAASSTEPSPAEASGD